MDKEIANLKSLYMAGRVKEVALKQKQGEINSLISKADKFKESKNKELMALTEYLQSIDQTQDQANVAKLDQEVRMLKNNIAMLDSNNVQMARLVQSLTVRK